MKPVRITKSSVPVIQKQRLSKTPRDIGLMKFTKETDMSEPFNAKLPKNATLKSKVAKPDKRKHRRQKSDFKENSNTLLINKPIELMQDNSNTKKETDKCIEQIEQELSQLKKLTRVKKSLTNNTVIECKSDNSNDIPLIKLIKTKCLDCPEFILQLKRIINENTTDKQIGRVHV